MKARQYSPINQCDHVTRRQRFWIGGTTLFALTVGVIAFSSGGAGGGPMHNGKSLQEWFDSLDPVASYSAEDPNVSAIIAIGSDAVPFLMHELRTSDSRWSERFRRLWSKLGLVRRAYIPARVRRERAYYCLHELGPNADSALPELIRIAEDESHPSCYWSVELLGFFRSNATTVVPALEKRIATPPQLRAPALFMAAVNSLAKHGTNARSALPRLKEIEADDRIPLEIRIEAACAILAINPANRQSVDFIVAQWEHSNASQGSILYAFRYLGTNAIPALPAMRRIAQTGSETYERLSVSNEMRWLETIAGMEPSQPR